MMELNKKNIIEYWEQSMLPLVFVLSPLINIAFYYLGLCYKENVAREYGFIAISIAFAIVAGGMFLNITLKERFKWHIWVICIVVVLFFAVNFIVGIMSTKSIFLKESLQRFIVFCMPALMIGVCAAKLHTEQYFILILEKYSFFVLPAVVIFINQVLFDCNPFSNGRDLGIINYMSFSYTLMPLLMANIIQLIEKKELHIPFYNKPLKFPLVCRTICIVIYWVAMYSTGGRGSVICTLFFIFLIIVYRIIRKQEKKGIILISLLMVGVLSFNLFVYAPSGMRWLGRMNIFIDGLAEGKIITTYEEDGDTTNEENTGTKIENIASRGTLFKLSFKEFKESPFTGMGAGGFTQKYQIYPHNAILELLAETGILGASVIISIVLFAILNLLRNGWKDMSVMCVLAYFLTYALQANISGSIWECSVLLCAIGYGVTYKRPNDN